jgi:radical SAM superfamily enzyme YgiQ (UPF0313 family)
MKITLISPSFMKVKTRSVGKLARFFKVPPMGLLNVAAVTPADIELTIIDEDFKDIDFDSAPDLVGISAMTATAPRAYEIASEFRRKGVPVVLGGPHPSLMYEEAREFADSVVIGEAEGAWEKLLEDFVKEGRSGLKPRYQNQSRPDLAAIPFPRRDLLKSMGNYAFTNLLHVSRGCPYNCSFCSVKHLLGSKPRHRPVSYIVEQVKAIRKDSLIGKVFIFLDDNIMVNNRYAKELFKELAALDIMWISQTSVNSTDDDELVELAGKSGCLALFIGLESISENSLEEVGKSQNKIDYYEQAVRKLHRQGIFVEGAFIFGFDSDRKDVFEKTVKFAEKLRLDGVQYSALTPLPGTDLYETIESENRFIDRDWSKYDCAQVVFRPLHMSPEELHAGLSWAYKRTYSFWGILRRISSALCDSRIRHFPHLVAFNIGYRSSYKHRFKNARNPNRKEQKQVSQSVMGLGSGAVSERG